MMDENGWSDRAPDTVELKSPSADPSPANSFDKTEARKIHGIRARKHLCGSSSGQ